MSPAQSLPTAADILNRFYEAERIYMTQPLSTRDFSGMAACLSPEVKLHQSPDLPYGGVYHGREGWLACFKAMGEAYSALDVVEPRVLEGEDEVVVLSTLKLTGRKTGREWVQPLCQHVMVDREKGVITDMRPWYWDVAGLKEVIG